MKSVSYGLLFCVLLLAGACGNHTQKKTPTFEKDVYGVVNKINPDQKEIYLVFTAHYSQNDQGYFENFDGIVPVLDTLASRGVKGSFFPTGVCFGVEKYRKPIQRIIDEGHYLSAHSDSHLLLCAYENRDSTLVTADSLRQDIAAMEARLQSFGLTKEQYAWMIPPYEYYNQYTADVLRELGFSLANPTEGLETSLDWMGPQDANYCSAAQLVANVWAYEKAHTLNGTILLIHAMNYPGRTPEDRMYAHLGTLIDNLKEKGYTFRTFKDVPRDTSLGN